MTKHKLPSTLNSWPVSYSCSMPCTAPPAKERLPQLTALPEEGLKAWLAEMQYLASETLAEIERHAAPRAVPELRLLRGSAGKRRRPAI